MKFEELAIVPLEMDSRGIPEIINHIQLIHIERDTVQSVINNQLKLQMGVDSVGTFNTSTSHADGSLADFPLDNN